MRTLLGIGLVILLLGAGCGGDDEPEGEPIPGDQAEAITTQLDQIADDISTDPPRCGGASFKLGELRKKIDALPSDVSQEVRDALSDGADKLETAVERECEEVQETTTEEAPPTTTEEAPPPTTTEEAPTTTEEAPTTTEEQPDQTDEQPPSDTPPGDGGTPIPPGQDNGGAGGDG